MFRRALRGAGVALTAFHVWLFARQAWAGELASPEALLKWAGAALLIAALFALSRQGASLVRGRKAVAIWLLAALLHAPAIGQRLESLDLPAIPEAIVTLSQALAAAAIGGVLLLLWIARTTARPAPAARRPAAVFFPAASVAALALQPFSPRPPPSA